MKTLVIAVETDDPDAAEMALAVATEAIRRDVELTIYRAWIRDEGPASA